MPNATTALRRVCARCLLLVLCAASVDAARAFDFAEVTQRARALSAQPYEPPANTLTDELLGLNYDQLRDIRYRPAANLCSRRASSTWARSIASPCASMRSPLRACARSGSIPGCSTTAGTVSPPKPRHHRQRGSGCAAGRCRRLAAGASHAPQRGDAKGSLNPVGAACRSAPCARPMARKKSRTGCAPTIVRVGPQAWPASPIGVCCTSSLSMRAPSRSTTSKRQPCQSKCSPACGMRPKRAIIMPATVL